jgi:hypothetical protein
MIPLQHLYMNKMEHRSKTVLMNSWRIRFTFVKLWSLILLSLVWSYRFYWIFHRVVFQSNLTNTLKSSATIYSHIPQNHMKLLSTSLRQAPSIYIPLMYPRMEASLLKLKNSSRLLWRIQGPSSNLRLLTIYLLREQKKTSLNTSERRISSTPISLT